jgi:hypothetical protein
MKPAHYEILPAKSYYSHGFATGSVVLMNGSVLFHGDTKLARALYKKKTKQS